MQLYIHIGTSTNRTLGAAWSQLGIHIYIAMRQRIYVRHTLCIGDVELELAPKHSISKKKDCGLAIGFCLIFDCLTSTYVVYEV